MTIHDVEMNQCSATLFYRVNLVRKACEVSRKD
jgi:hypothetical protein